VKAKGSDVVGKWVWSIQDNHGKYLNYHERVSRVRCRMKNLVVEDIENSGACRFGLVY